MTFFGGIATGSAILLVGLLGLLLWTAVQFRNPAALIMWGLTILAVLMTRIYGMSNEIVWLTMMGAVVLLIVGISARLMR